MFSNSADPTLALQAPYGQEEVHDMIQISELGMFAEQIEEIDTGLDHDALNSFPWPMEWEQCQESTPVDPTFQEADVATDMVVGSDMVEETHMIDESDDNYPEASAPNPESAEEVDYGYPEGFALNDTPVPEDENMSLDIADTVSKSVWQCRYSINPDTQPDLGLVLFDQSRIEGHHLDCLPIPAQDPFPENNGPIFDQSKALEAGVLVPYNGQAINYQRPLQSPVPEVYSPIIVNPVFGQAGAFQPFFFNGTQFGDNQQLAGQQPINLQPVQGFLDLPQQIEANPLSQVPFQMPPPMIIQNFFAADTINVSYDRRDQVPSQ